MKREEDIQVLRMMTIWSYLLQLTSRGGRLKGTIHVIDWNSDIKPTWDPFSKTGIKISNNIHNRK